MLATVLQIYFMVVTLFMEYNLPPGACSGQCSGRLHDPCVVYREETDTFYRFTTNDGLHTATAPSIAGPWTEIGAAMPNGSIINLPGSKDLWSPDVTKFNNLYYLYYAVSVISSQNSDIGVATSPSMDPGTWTDHGSLGIPDSSRYNKIDPNFFMGDLESPLLNFGSFWENIFQVRLEDFSPLKLRESGIQIAAQETNLIRSHESRPAIEGAFQWQWNGTFYMFFSEGNCCDEPGVNGGLAPPGQEYKVMVCKSLEPSWGFVDKDGKDCLTEEGGSLVLGSHDDVYAPGGQGVMYDPQQKVPVLYYHYVRPSVSYAYDDFFFGWNKLDFSTGWPVPVA